MAVSLIVISALSVTPETTGQSRVAPRPGDSQDSIEAAPRAQAIIALLASSIRTRFGLEGPTPSFNLGPNGWGATLPPEDLVVPIPPPSARVIAAAPEPTEEPVAAAEPSAVPTGTPAPVGASTGVSGMSFANNNILGIDLARLPQNGAAYERVRALAVGGGSLNYGDNNGPNNNVLLAKAAFGDKAGVLAMIRAAKGTLTSSIIHNAAARNLAATAIALNLVNAHEEDGWLLMARDMAYDGGQQTLLYAAGRSNNHGSAADQSLVAIDLHLNDRAHLQSQVIPTIRQRLGDDMGIELRVGDSVQADPANPVTIGLPGTFALGVSLDGLLLEEQRRESGFPNCGGYNFGASGQILLSVWLLEVAGYPAQEWGQRAIHRVFARLTAMGCAPEGDDRWQGHMYNALAGRAVLPEAVGDGKTMGITDYLLSGR